MSELLLGLVLSLLPWISDNDEVPTGIFRLVSLLSSGGRAGTVEDAFSPKRFAGRFIVLLDLSEGINTSGILRITVPTVLGRACVEMYYGL